MSEDNDKSPLSDPEPLEKLVVSQEEHTPPPAFRTLGWRLGITFLFSVFVIFSATLALQFTGNLNTTGLTRISQLIIGGMDDHFGWYVLAGFVAQMIDGALGMAYGVSVTTFLMSLGLPAITPAVASASMHASEIFTTGSGSLVYMRFRNINKKLFRAMVLPGMLGAAVGATLISLLGKSSFIWLKPMVAVYTGILGVLILQKALRRRKNPREKIKRVGWLALAGGIMDSIGGGGWGPIVTGSLIAGGRNLRYSIGSSHLTKFFVVMVSTITFFVFIGLDHWQIILGLVIGGMVAAPLSIFLSNKIPVRAGLVIVGSLVILLAVRTILRTFIPSFP
jgi:uncharacterized membrane protein YfcA